MDTAKEQQEERAHRVRPLDEAFEEENELAQLLILTWNKYSPHPDDWDERLEEQTYLIDLDEDAPLSVLSEGLELDHEHDFGEYGEISFTIKLVQRRTKNTKKQTVDHVSREKNASRSDKNDERVLASCKFKWWQNGYNTSLMNFNQLSQDLADLCYDLWTSSGKPQHEYNDCDIEMGDSRHSNVRVNDVIEAIACRQNQSRNESDQLPTTDCFETAYIKSCECNESSANTVLLESLLTLLGPECILIGHGSDLEKLEYRTIPSGFFSQTEFGDFAKRWYLHIPNCSPGLEVLPVKTTKELDEKAIDHSRRIDHKTKEENEVQQLLILTWNKYSPHPDDLAERLEEQTYLIDLDEDAPLSVLSEGLELDHEHDFGEYGEISFTIKLVQRRTKNTKKQTVDHVSREKNASRSDKNDERVLASCKFKWWQNGYNTSLMNFNQLSQDLADLCYDLWTSSGKPQHEYNDCDIEMGDSRHSNVRVNDVIEAIACRQNQSRNESDQLPTTDCFETAYIKSCECNESSANTVLLESLLTLLGPECVLIGHGSDLEKLEYRTIPSGFFSQTEFGDFAKRWYLHIPR